ncbi:copper homeostasis membrane protein CopD [Altererythrobacter sp. KTW20L]|uniref:copper homeostasis membrane protein CopD n=1 Tax=Altererythrobacter sp. KTW20L TaxID=2942210 RepID=UPI0020C00F3B|nr:copper homeostasis membrane protein CopD [Altererythrobacter sp. KTW20L]MCL6250459.1 copper homeostasis membrane protein CopD [Altererythrobacter sp. KTW20L]
MTDWLHLLLRFLHYVVLIGLFGLIAYRVTGFRKFDVRDASGTIAALAVTGATLAPVLSAALFLVSIGGMMGQSPWKLDAATIEAMVLSTEMGWAFLARLAFLLAALAIIVVWTKFRRGLGLAAIFYALALLTLGWTGHAAATEGPLGHIHRINNWAHLLAGGLWIGAVVWFLVLTVKAHRDPQCFAPQPLLERLHRFAPWGVSLVATVALTGLINVHLIFGLDATLKTLETEYGRLLLVKVLFVGAMLGCGARNAAISRRRHKSGHPSIGSDPAALTALRGSLAIELLLAAAVIAFVAAIGINSPME